MVFILDYISIHLMLRFNPDFSGRFDFCSKFQYILCYGSTDTHIGCPKNKERFQYILCYGSTLNITKNPSKKNISIHLMLRFNYTNLQNFLLYVGFQYILCYGSTAMVNLDWLIDEDFNTSYVTVQLYWF